MVASWLAYYIMVEVFLKDSSDLLEMIFEGRIFHYLLGIRKQSIPNVFEECLI